MYVTYDELKALLHFYAGVRSYIADNSIAPLQWIEFGPFSATAKVRGLDSNYHENHNLLVKATRMDLRLKRIPYDTIRRLQEDGLLYSGILSNNKNIFYQISFNGFSIRINGTFQYVKWTFWFYEVNSMDKQQSSKIPAGDPLKELNNTLCIRGKRPIDSAFFTSLIHNTDAGRGEHCVHNIR